MEQRPDRSLGKLRASTACGGGFTFAHLSIVTPVPAWRGRLMRVTSGGAGTEPALNGIYATPREPFRWRRSRKTGREAPTLTSLLGISWIAPSANHRSMARLRGATPTGCKGVRDPAGHHPFDIRQTRQNPAVGDLGGILVGHVVGVHAGRLDEAANQELADELPGLGRFRGGQTYWAPIQAARRYTSPRISRALQRVANPVGATTPIRCVSGSEFEDLQLLSSNPESCRWGSNPISARGRHDTCRPDSSTYTALLPVTDTRGATRSTQAVMRRECPSRHNSAAYSPDV